MRRLLASYMNQRRSRLGELPLIRWWLSEYLGRIMAACGLGVVICGTFKLTTPLLIGWGTFAAGTLITVLAGLHGSNIVDCSREEK